MLRSRLQTLTVALAAACVSCCQIAWAEDPPHDAGGDSQVSGRDAKTEVSDAKAIEGLWHGSWGGGERDGVVFQPVLAEMIVEGDRIELTGFRNANTLTGAIRIDAGAREMRITPAAAPGGKSTSKDLLFTYAIKDDELTLVDDDKIAVTLHRQRVVKDPLANAQLEFVAAQSIDAAGDLLVTEFTILAAGERGTTYHAPQARSLKTRQAAVFLVQEADLKKLTLDEARTLLRESTLVAVTYRQDNAPPPHQFRELWQDKGPPSPDSGAVRRTLAKTLRTGTLVFVLSAKENAPLP